MRWEDSEEGLASAKGEAPIFRLNVKEGDCRTPKDEDQGIRKRTSEVSSRKWRGTTIETQLFPGGKRGRIYLERRDFPVEQPDSFGVLFFRGRGAPSPHRG